MENLKETLIKEKQELEEKLNKVGAKIERVKLDA